MSVRDITMHVRVSDATSTVIVGCDGFRADGGPIIEKCIIDDQMNEILVTAIQKCRGARLLVSFVRLGGQRSESFSITDRL